MKITSLKSLLFLTLAMVLMGCPDSSNMDSTVDTIDSGSTYVTQANVLQSLGDLDLNYLDIATIDPAFAGASLNVSSPLRSSAMITKSDEGNDDIEMLRVFQARRYNIFKTLGVWSKLYYTILSTSSSLFTYGDDTIVGEFDGIVPVDLSSVDTDEEEYDDEEEDSILDFYLNFNVSEYSQDYWQMSANMCFPFEMDDDDEGSILPTGKMIFQATDGEQPSRLFGSLIAPMGDDMNAHKFLAYLGNQWPPNENDIKLLAYGMNSGGVDIFYWHMEHDAENDVYYSAMDWYGSYEMGGDGATDMFIRVEAHPDTTGRAGYTHYVSNMAEGDYCMTNGLDEGSIELTDCPGSIIGELVTSKSDIVSTMDELAGEAYFEFVSPYDLNGLESIFDDENNTSDVLMLWNALFQKAQNGAWWCLLSENNLDSASSAISENIITRVADGIDTIDNGMFYPDGYPDEWMGGDSNRCNRKWLGEGVSCAGALDRDTCNRSYSTAEWHEGDPNDHVPRNCSWYYSDGEEEWQEEGYVCGHASCDPCEMQ
ncbi:MAG: hypothetical protein HN337_00575 [Deltaproteobacteria bacterium]|nr:hypothetical protein [Deltaproteobacteria bacterium]